LPKPYKFDEPISRAEVVLFAVIVLGSIGVLTSEILRRDVAGSVQSIGAIAVVCGLAAARKGYRAVTTVLLLAGALVEVVWYVYFFR
jgi:hypothetical protein